MLCLYDRYFYTLTQRYTLVVSIHVTLYQWIYSKYISLVLTR